MTVSNYDLDSKIFALLNNERKQLEDWKAHASDIADYVATWGVERFWAMSRSKVQKGGKIPKPDKAQKTDEEIENRQSYFAWSVAREVLCQIVGSELDIKADMSTENFQSRFRGLNLNHQILLTDMLIEIASSVQFWTMRIASANDAGVEP